jgi:hypothetical protein
MSVKKVITICKHCKEITYTPPSYKEDLVVVNFCPNCEDQANEDYKETLYVKYYERGRK